MERYGQDNIQAPSETEPQVYKQLAGSLASNANTKPRTAAESAQQKAKAFKKGGVMTALGEYIAENTTASAPSRKGSTQTSSHRLGPQINSSNVGYQLLQKAGWTEGQGLGSNQQGRPIPLGAYHQQARQGIGTSNAKQADKRQHGQDSSGKKRRSSDSQDQGRTAPQKLPVPDVPEDSQVKRQRHQQILQTEADDAAEKALQQYMYRAFNDFSGAPTTDSNPLMRQSRLSRTNPLL